MDQVTQQIEKNLNNQARISAQKTKNHTQLIVIILFLISSFVFGITGFFLGRQTQPQPIDFNSQQELLSTVSPIVETPVISPSSSPTDGPSVKCPDGYILYENQVFSICQPRNMTARSNIITRPDQPNTPNESVTFEDNVNIFTVNTSFEGGWGGGTCNNSKTNINGLETSLLVWDSDGEIPCSENIINIAAIIGSGNDGSPFPIAIDNHSKEETYHLNKDIFDVVLNSFHVK